MRLWTPGCYPPGAIHWIIDGSPSLRKSPRPRRDSMSLPSGLSRLFKLEALEGKLCGPQMVTPIGSTSGLFNASRRMKRTCFYCHRTAPPLTRPSTSCSRDGTILTATRSSNTSSSCETRVLSSKRKTLHSCLLENGKNEDPQNQFLTDGVLLVSPLQEWTHTPLPTLNFWPPGSRSREPLCPLRLQCNFNFTLRWEEQGKALGRPP